MQNTKYLLLTFVTLSLACGGSDPDSSPSKTTPDTKGTKDASATSASGRDAAVSDDPNPDRDGRGADGGTVTGGGGGDGHTQADAGSFAPVDAAAVPLNDAGQLSGSGSCCAEHDTPGCNNADLMVCVCEKDPTCCTTAWGKQCAFIVEQKYCQEGVRDCVCQEWGKTECCGTAWTSTCDSVAKIKCDAVPGCF
ncbi:MAG: hypothetical protein JWN48_35 [Myxococcaceae bacterium]|nr:hypothetical protein [Myxococcaceae bacterium]